MNKITINGKSYTSNGNINIINGKVMCNGKAINETDDSKNVEITIIGNIEELTVDYASKVKVEGSVGSIRTSSGNVEISGNVSKDIKTSSGDVECKDVSGSIETTSGDVRCGSITGSVKTVSGDIKNKK